MLAINDLPAATCVLCPLTKLMCCVADTCTDCCEDRPIAAGLPNTITGCRNAFALPVPPAARAAGARHGILGCVGQRAHRVVRIPQAFRLMLHARLRQRFHHALGIDQLLLGFPHVERLARCRLWVGGEVQALARAHCAIIVGAQVEAAAEIRAARIATLVDQVAKVQQVWYWCRR